MAGVTLAQAEAQLASWIAASTAVASRQSYSIGSRTVTKADAREIREQITYWNNMVLRLDRGGIRVRGGTPA